MHEELLHFIWQHRLYKVRDCRTVQGEDFEIIHPGTYNQDAGPDFFNAKIRFGNTILAGNVEVHHLSSDWYRHRHHEDDHYNNVILHVVGKEDGIVKNKSGYQVPSWEMDFNKEIIELASEFELNFDWLRCRKYINNVSVLDLAMWQERMLIEKLELKCSQIEIELSQTYFDWDQVFYQLLSRSFGFGLNSDCFYELARITPLNLLLKHRHSLLQIEALLYGQAGMLTAVHEESYYLNLQREYAFLKDKYNLKAMNGLCWKFMRLRPINFPTIRIAQLAAFFYSNQLSFEQLFRCETKNEVYDAFNYELSPYWQNHYVFGKDSIKKSKLLGVNSINSVIINAIAPYLFSYGSLRNIEADCERAMLWLRSLPAEKNRVIQQWQNYDVSVGCAADTQALIHWSRFYCAKGNCLRCNLGHKIFAVQNHLGS